jgi:hypothetical protein
MLPTAGNESSMRILLGNDIAAKVLREQDRIGIGKSPTTIKTVSGQGHSFSLHAKVGYFQDDSTSQVHSAFISTQNPTHTLARAHTTEEMLVLTSKSTLDGTPRAHIRNELIENIKHVTDSIHEAFDDIKRSTPGVSVDAMRQHLSLTNPRDLVEKVTAYYKAKTPSRANQSVFVGKEIQQQIADRLQRIAGDKGGSKVVLSIQYLETLLIQNGNSTRMTASSLTSSGGDDYNTRIRTPLLQSIKLLAEAGRISIGLAGSSYGTQGLFSLLDRYYDDSLPDTDLGKQTVAALINSKAFSVLPTRFAHSKSFAAYDDKGLTMFGIGSSNISLSAYENNLEVSMILDKDSGTLGGLTDKEQEDILSYYKYGVSNFESKHVSSPTERKGSEKQTRELINLLKSMGGKQTRDSSGVDSDFTFSVRYSQHNYRPIGLDIKINSINK